MNGYLIPDGRRQRLRHNNTRTKCHSNFDYGGAKCGVYVRLSTQVCNVPDEHRSPQRIRNEKKRKEKSSDKVVGGKCASGMWQSVE